MKEQNTNTPLDARRPARLRLDLTLSLALMFAIAVETASALSWAGRTAARLDAVELAARDLVHTPESLARLEAHLSEVRAGVERIERRLDASQRPRRTAEGR
jgi:hypothetical protein